MNRTILTLLPMSCLLLLGSPARAEDSALQQQIARATKEQPVAFLSVADLKQRMPELDRKRRGPFAPVGPVLKSMGPSVFLPLVEQVLGGLAGEPGWTPTARTGWAIGVLEALGQIGDARARGPVEALLSHEGEPKVVRACAATLSRLGCEAALPVLAPLAQKAGPKQAAVLSGLGECRQLQAVQVVASVLAERPDEAVAKAAAKALGSIANSWVWQTEGLAGRTDRAAIRVAAAKALVDGFVAQRGDVRAAVESALVIVDAPEAAGLLEQARARAPDQSAELQRLAARLANSPMRDRVR